MQTPLIAFITELLNRFAAKSPKFFVIWQWISGVVAAITGIPAALQEFNINLPAAFHACESKIVAIASIAMLVMAKLPVQNAVVNKDASGAPLTKTDPDTIPFTASDQIKKNNL